MFNKKVIIIGVLSFLILVITIHFLDGTPSVDLEYIGSLFVLFAFFIMVSMILAVLVAAFPFKTNVTPTKTQILSSLPLVTISLAVIGVFAFMITRPSYEKAQTPGNLVCQKIRAGSFTIDGYIIERSSDTQTETIIKTQEKTTYSIKWINSCEYELVNVKDPLDVSKVKITAVTNNHYDCIIEFDGRVSKHRVQIIKNGNKHRIGALLHR